MKISYPLMENNISEEDLQLVIKFLKTKNVKLTHGPRVKQFEMVWSKWLGTRRSVFVNSGSSANDLTMKAIKIREGKGEVIVPPLTWVSDIASILNNNLTPVFVDINLENLAIDENKLLEVINEKTKAIFITHVLGLNGMSKKIIDISKSTKKILVEDVCESHGATFNKKKCGTLGLISNFSFYYAHHISTIEGGMICTSDEEYYQLFLSLRSHGLLREMSDTTKITKIKKKYPELNPDFIFLNASHNMRPTEIQAVLGLSQIKLLDHKIKVRKKNFDYFLKSLNPNRFYTQFNVNGNSNYAFIIIMRDKNFKLRNAIESALTKHNIEFRRGLSGGGNQLRQPYILNVIRKKIDLKKFPNVEHVHHFSWYVGNYPNLDKSLIDKLVDILNNTKI